MTLLSSSFSDLLKQIIWSRPWVKYSKVLEHPYLVRDSLMPNCFWSGPKLISLIKNSKVCSSSGRYIFVCQSSIIIIPARVASWGIISKEQHFQGVDPLLLLQPVHYSKLSIEFFLSICCVSLYWEETFNFLSPQSW